MAITSDGTQKFGISDSPVTIDGSTYVCESMNFTYGSTRVDINDSNGEPLGSTIVPSRVEVSGTVQYATGATGNPALGAEMSASGITFLLTEVGDTQTQADYAKCNVSGYEKIN